jgi:(1->4)-alpha-D-glucan 1-alpha-D-glucosylmutase
MIYQSLLGIFPPDALCLSAGKAAGSTPPRSGVWDPRAQLAERLRDYIIKAAREAKNRTNWYEPNEDYEQALTEFIDELCQSDDAADFRCDVEALSTIIAFHGAVNSLAQLVVKLAAPGVPDIYQGCELWDFSLVDPDNRQPVDFALRESLLDKAGAGGAATLVDNWLSGVPKMALLAAGLRARRQHPTLFAEGRYDAVEVSGECARHVVAFQRTMNDASALVVAPRFVLNLLTGEDRPLVPALRWRDTAVVLPRARLGRAMRNLVTGELHDCDSSLLLHKLLSSFPVALLVEVDRQGA